jgi:hypothetical protein
MSVQKQILLAGALLLVATSAQAKGPQGVGAGVITTPPTSNSHGLGSNTWTQPPGWSNAQQSKGWQNGGGLPPGFDGPGSAKGWDGNSLPPGLQNR